MYKLIVAAVMFASVAGAQTTNGQYAATQAGLLNGSTVFTVEFWVKTTDSRSSTTYWQRPTLFGNVTDGDNSGDFGITINNGYIGMWEGLSTLNTDQQFLSNSVRINNDFYHHIAAVNNGQTINLYVDGMVVGSLVSGRQLRTMAAPPAFGAASLDYVFAGNTAGNKNFAAQATFGEARISGTTRYGANFSPAQSLPADGSSVAVYQFSTQGYNGQPLNPNQPVIFTASETINNNAAQTATLFLKDSTPLYGKLFLAKKDWSLSDDIYIRFFEGSSKKVTYYKPEEVLGFQMGDSWYEPKLLGSGPVSTPYKKTFVKRLTPAGSKMAMYEYNTHLAIKNAMGTMEYKNITGYFVQLPNSTDDKVYQFGDNKFVPHFDAKVSAIVAAKPALAQKILSKDKEWFYAFVTEEGHQSKVWWNIINEYNQH